MILSLATKYTLYKEKSIGFMRFMRKWYIRSFFFFILKITCIFKMKKVNNLY